MDLKVPITITDELTDSVVTAHAQLNLAPWTYGVRDLMRHLARSRGTV